MSEEALAPAVEKIKDVDKSIARLRRSPEVEKVFEQKLEQEAKKRVSEAKSLRAEENVRHDGFDVI